MTEADSIACDHSAAFASDRVVRLVATDGYQVHRLIYEALAKDGVRDFLFAPFPAAGPMNTAFVSGSTIRGKLRHACADVYLEREKQRGRRVDYERYLELKAGGVKGSSRWILDPRFPLPKSMARAIGGRGRAGW